MSKLLVLGGSHSDVPLIESATIFGHDVYTTGNRADHPGHRLSSGHFHGDFSQLEEMLELAQRLNVNFIVPGANDFAMMSAAYVAEQMKLPGYDSFAITTLLHRKDKFKDFANSIDMPICRYVTLDPCDDDVAIERVDRLRYPLIVKPVDLTGGKGISRVDVPAQLRAAINEARQISRQNSVVIEEWFDGELHSYSTIIENGKIIFEYFDSEFSLYQDYLVSTSLSVCPIHQDAREIVKVATLRMVKELGLVDGVLHSQFLARDKEARIIEYTRRMSGDLYSKVVQLVRGFRHQDIFIASATSQPISPILNTINTVHQPFVSRHCVTSEKCGKFIRIKIDENIRNNIVSITPIVPFGASVADDGRSKVAVVILSFNSESEMNDYIVNCKANFICEVE